MSKIVYKDPNITVFQSALFQTNSVVVQTEDAIFLVDPCWLPDEVASIRQYVLDIQGDKPLFLLFTHSDYDHIIGYRAFKPEKVFLSEAMANRTDKETVLREINDFDQQYYIQRSYPIEYPEGDFIVFKNGAQFRHGNTRLTFYLTPGHTPDCMMIIFWQLGLCVAGDYLSDIEFPFIDQSSVAYEETLNLLLQIHDRNWFTRLIPGHGNPALSLSEWLGRRTGSLAYIYALRESIATGKELDEESLWERYPFPKYLKEAHAKNRTLLQKEFDEGLWSLQE
jgi:glyoxylase-like metal-dependent hydrolase (beta-lactamase superfamily II)